MMKPASNAPVCSTADILNLDILERYNIGVARVYITHDGRYLVDEPPITEEAAKLYDSVVSRINLSLEMETDLDPETLAGRFADAFWEVAERMKRIKDARRLFPKLDYYIRRNLAGYGLLDVFMRDSDIEDILCSAPARPIRVVHKRYSGRFNTLVTNVAFPGDMEMQSYIQRIFGRTGSEPTEAKPMSVTHMADGSRISVTFADQISKPGSAIAIRRFPKKPFTMPDMIKSGTITADMAAYLWTLLDAKAVGLVIGVTGSGKTTFLSSLVSMMNPRWRILTIEDTLELRIPHGDWVRLNTRKSYGVSEERFDVTIRNLIDISLTQRPDYEIVGETRLYDMDALFQSVGTGHGGLTSFHASTPQGALSRLRGGDIGDGELGLLWFVVHAANVRRLGKYYRKISGIFEIITDDTGRIQVCDIYRYDIFADTFGGAGPDSSRRYSEALEICGISDADTDMKRRISLLNDCVQQNVSDTGEVFQILGRYYDDTS